MRINNPHGEYLFTIRGGMTTDPKRWLSDEMGCSKKASKKKAQKKKKSPAPTGDKANAVAGDKAEPIAADATNPEAIPEPPKRAKPGPKGKPDGFRAECYPKINKGIDRNTEMIVVKQRHRLGDGTNVFPGDSFPAHKMDARIICGSMDRYWIMPLKDKPNEGERHDHYVVRMMKIYEPGTAIKTCGKK